MCSPKRPNQISTVVHTSAGDSTTTYDGRAGWIAGPATERPVALLELTGGDLAGAKLDAALWFPAQIKQALTEWRAASSATIDGRDMQMIQGSSDGRYPVNLYFDSKSGLLARVVRYDESPVGLNPTQIDYADYREVAGVRMPYRVTVTWLDGKSTTEFSRDPAERADGRRRGSPGRRRNRIWHSSGVPPSSDDREPWTVLQPWFCASFSRSSSATLPAGR